MKKYLLFIIFICITKFTYCQKLFFKYPIYSDLLDHYIYAYDKTDSSITCDLSSSQLRHFKLFDYDSSNNSKITFKISYFDTSRKVRSSGSYLIDPKVKKIKKTIIPVGAGGIIKRKIIDFYFLNAIRIDTWRECNITDMKKNKNYYSGKK